MITDFKEHCTERFISINSIDDIRCNNNLEYIDNRHYDTEFLKEFLIYERHSKAIKFWKLFLDKLNRKHNKPSLLTIRAHSKVKNLYDVYNSINNIDIVEDNTLEYINNNQKEYGTKFYMFGTNLMGSILLKHDNTITSHFILKNLKNWYEK